LRVFFISNYSNSPMMELVVGRGGDLETISGVPNFEQALNILAHTEKKTLKAHSTYGLPRPVGQRSIMAAASQWAIEILQTVQSDPRISDIINIGVGVQGDLFVGRADIVGQQSLAKFPVTTIQGRR